MGIEWSAWAGLGGSEPTQVDVAEGAGADFAAEPEAVPDPQLHACNPNSIPHHHHKEYRASVKLNGEGRPVQAGAGRCVSHSRALCVCRYAEGRRPGGGALWERMAECGRAPHFHTLVNIRPGGDSGPVR